jgi:hypothetical protein
MRATSRCRSGIGANPSNPDPLDLVKVDLVAGAVVEHGRLGRLVEGDGLGLFRGPAILPPLSATIQALETQVFSSSGPTPEISITGLECTLLHIATAYSGSSMRFN